MTGCQVMVKLMLTFVLTPGVTHALTPARSVDLVNYLFDSTFYNSQVRPVAWYNETLPVLLQLDLFSITEVDPAGQSMTSLGRLHLYWLDHLLRWNASSQGGIPELLVKQGSVWTPDIVLTNGAEVPQPLGHKDLPLYLQQCGSIYWNPVVKLVSHCDVSITYFPFDYQRCHIEFGTEMSMAFEVEVFIHSTINEFWQPFSLYNYRGHPDWEIVETSADSLRNDQPKQRIVRFSVLLERKNPAHILTLVGPLLVLAVTACLVFVLPTEGGDKFTTGATVLLAYTIYMGLFYSGVLPDTGSRVSLLTVYLLCLLLTVTLVLVSTVVSLRVQHRPVWLPVGPRAARFTRRVNGRSRKLDHVMSVDTLRDIPIPMPDYPAFSPHRPRKHITSTSYQMNADNGFMMGGAAFASSINGKRLSDPLNDDNESEVSREDRPKVKNNKQDLPPVTWPEVAKAMDRVCLVVFGALIIVLTVIFFLVMAVGGDSRKPSLTADSVTADVDFSRYYNQLCCGYDCITANTTTSYDYRRK